MEEIHKILKSINPISNGDVLATIILVEGSAYRKEGTSMLFKKSGKMVGILSAGCLEEDLSYHAQEARVHNASRTVIYDMRAEDDLSWGQGAGCNGVISVLLEPINDCMHGHLSKLKFNLDRGNRVTILKRLSNENTVSDYMFITDEKQYFGSWNKDEIEIAKKYLYKLHKNFSKSGIRFCSQLGANIYIHSFKPRPRLIIFGAGKDAIPLVKIASLAGLSIIVSDWRNNLCTNEYFPNAEQLLVGLPTEVIPRINLTCHDSVLIMTHNFQKDREILNLIKQKKLNYLGVLGGISRSMRLIDGIDIHSKIRSPAGLSIGAEGPEEIAISIVAELIQFQRIAPVEKVSN